MRRSIFLLFALVFLIPLKSTLAQGYKIKVQIEGAQDSIMYLVNYFADKQYIKDTVDNQGNGTFVFEGKKQLPQGIYLAVRQDKNYFEFLLTDDQKFSMKTKSSGMVENMNVKGSKENEKFYDFLKYSTPKNKRIQKLKKQKKNLSPDATARSKEIQAEIDSLNKQINEYKQKFISDYPESFMAEVYRASRDPEVPDAPDSLGEQEQKEWRYHYFIKHYFDNLDLQDEKMLHTPVLHQRISNFINNVVIQEPDSIIKACDRLMAMAEGNKEVTKYLQWYLTYNAERSEIMGMDEVFVHMVDNYYSKEKAPWVSNKMLKNLKERADKLRGVLIGSKAPNMLLMDTTGEFQPLHNVKSKYLVIYFWEPDCGHCQRETPKLKKLYDDMKDEGVEVYAVCIDRKNKKKMKEYINKHNLDWINVYDGKRWTSFRNLYDLISTPTIYLLDEKKEILAKRINVHQLRKFLKRKMKKDEEAVQENDN